ncbi:uncharacterized protein F5891DRAFT_1172155 [Suillus fuscotomentosus]|uniref:CHAT domain-containing protein n=1 Tax=Suillus fuscotomentosus TaxID=1912939 RepID=A0AAD4E9Y3_9AGAM|nr:uncharacterized protein F5891DRAFT_1172155 [Suillus fuscotomentosus]KAG1902072.1 hypothetical protein F5891DRAFT_1172155 [Suillus fuscotomentosus]
MPGTLESRYIKLELISGRNFKVPSQRIPAGIYISINLDSSRCWNSAIGVLLSDESTAWADTVTLSLDTSLALSVEIRASFELDRMLGNGEVVGKLETSWDALLDHRSEPFNISFPSVLSVHPSLTLEAVVLLDSDIQDSVLLNSVGECEIVRNTDAGHERFATYMTSNTVSHLNDAVQHFQSVLDQCPVGHLDRAAAFTNLAWARLQGYIQNDSQDIDSINSLFREALALRPQGHPDHPSSIYHLLHALIRCYSEEGTAVYIQESAQLSCKLLPLCPEGTFFHSIAAGANSIDYAIRACNNLPTDASDEGIHFRQVVLDLCTLGSEHRPRALQELAQAVEGRFQERGSIDALDECIQLRREASLHYRFDHQDNSHDLNEAISLYEEGLRLCPVGNTYRDFSLDNLGLALRTRFNQHSDVNDIMRAISLHREALTLCPPGNSYRETTLHNLALVLHDRYAKLDASEDLDEAIDLYRESLQLQQHGHPSRHKTLDNLSSALRYRFTQTQRNGDVEEAIRLCQESLDTLSSLHLDRYFSYMVLQETYLSRYRVQYDLADLISARIREAIDWAHQAEVYRHDSALEAYRICLELFDNHVMARSTIISRREAATAFRDAQSLPVDAASCSIRREDLQQAVELLEQGRGQQWSLASRLRTLLEDLEVTNSNFAYKFSELSKRLSDAHGSAGSADRVAADQAATQYRRLQEQWGAAVADIRNIPGFSRFLLPPSFTELQAAARHGPVIILVASQYSCSAIIVPTSGEPHHVLFPRITLVHLERLKSDFAREIRLASFMRPEETRKELQVLLRIVWDEIMLPIVIVLQRDLRVTSRSRIWLCPTATFTSIPLHAAHPFRTKADGRGRELCLENVYICSYTPTLSALIRSRQTMKTRVTTPSFAAIGQSVPGAGQGGALLTIDSELELVRKLVPTTAKTTTLSGDDATRADEPLTLLDIMENDTPQAEFAFLSACHTAVGDEETPNEVIHLAAGLQFSGFKSVIGTLWVVDDAIAKHVVEAFYENMFKDGAMDCTKAAWALNRATCSVKTKVPLEQRMVFIHIGITLCVTLPHSRTPTILFSLLQFSKVIRCSTITSRGLCFAF